MQIDAFTSNLTCFYRFVLLVSAIESDLYHLKEEKCQQTDQISKSAFPDFFLFALLTSQNRSYIMGIMRSGERGYDKIQRFEKIISYSTDKRIRFENDGAVFALGGKPVTLEIELYDADFYSIRFE